MRTSLLLLGLLACGIGPRLVGAEAQVSSARPRKGDLVIVGSGISGLAAALDAGRAGASVTVIDMWSVFGGHAVMSGGLVCLVDTPFQRARGIADSPDLAIRDFLSYGEDANADCVRLYSLNSRREIYDWLDGLGIRWARLFPRFPGNSVQRQHEPEERGVGLVSPVYRQCLGLTNIQFVWNTKVVSLLVEDGQIRGVRGIGLRTGVTNESSPPADSKLIWSWFASIGRRCFGDWMEELGCCWDRESIPSAAVSKWPQPVALR